MNKDFDKWLEDIQNAKAPESIENHILTLKHKKTRFRILKPLSLIFSLIFLVLFLTVNFVDSFYIMAQDTPLESFVNLIRLHDNWINDQESDGNFIEIEDDTFVSESLLSSFMFDNDTIVLKMKTKAPKAGEDWISVTLDGSLQQSTSFSAFEDDLDRDYHFRYTTFDIPITEGAKLTFKFRDMTYEYTVNKQDIRNNFIQVNETINTNGNSLVVESIAIGRAFSSINITNGQETPLKFGTLAVNLVTSSGKKIFSGHSTSYAGTYRIYFEHGGIENFKIEAIEVNYISWLDPNNRTVTFDPSTKLFDKHNDILKFKGFEGDTMVIWYDNISQFETLNLINPKNVTTLGHRANELLIGIKWLTPESFENFGIIEFSSYIPDVSDSTYHKIFIPKK